MLTIRTTLAKHKTDITICLLLAMTSLAYLMLRRWPLGAADEAYYFYHAIRMLDGESLYRDIFELTTPLFIDFLALMFHLFGETFLVGRAVGSTVQALLLVVIYATLRTLGAGRLLATAAALTHLAVGQPAWPYTTPHWAAVLIVCVLLLISLDRRRARTFNWIIVQGLLLGLLVATRQHAGVAVSIGMTLLITIDRLNDWVWKKECGMPTVRHFVLLGGSALISFCLVMGPHLYQAGLGPILSQLVVHPLTGYREFNQVSWGTNYLFEQSAFTWPLLLKYLPIVIVFTGLRAALAFKSRDNRHSAEVLLVLTVFGSAAVAFTMSFPDLVHLAMILPIILIVAVELLLFILRKLSQSNFTVQGLAALIIIAFCLPRLYSNYIGALHEYPIQHYTQFGTLPFATYQQITDFEWVKEQVVQKSDGKLFAYPGWAAIYLMTGSHNPTRHELIIPVYQSEEEIHLLITTLDQKRVRNVLTVTPLIQPQDPVKAYVDQKYHCMDKTRFQLCKRSDEYLGPSE